MKTISVFTRVGAFVGFALPMDEREYVNHFKYRKRQLYEP
jgi:hypothetical protein